MTQGRLGGIVINGVLFTDEGVWSAGTYAANSVVYYGGTNAAKGTYATATSTSLEPGAGDWHPVALNSTVAGPKGDPGVNADGVIFRTTDPVDDPGGTGTDGDVCIMTAADGYDAWDVLHKESGSWVLKGNIKGAAGTPGAPGAGDNDSVQWTDTGTDYTVTGGGGTINFGGAKDMKVVIPADGDYLISAEVCEDWSAVTAATGEAVYYQLVKTVGSGAPLAVSGNLIGTAMSTLAAAIVGANVFGHSWQVVVPGLVAGDEVSLQAIKIGSSTGAIKIRSAFGDANCCMNAVKCS